MTESQRTVIWEETVTPDFVDYNGHMNVAFYVLIFDHATDAFLEEIGMNEKHRAETGSSVFVGESHITYVDEVMEGEIVYVTSQLLDYDDKRLHLFLEMNNRKGNSLCATIELMILQVNLNTRKVGPFPDAVLAQIDGIYLHHKNLPAPKEKGRVIGIRRGGSAK